MNNHFAILLFCYFAILLQLLLLHIPSILTFPSPNQDINSG